MAHFGVKPSCFFNVHVHATAVIKRLLPSSPFPHLHTSATCGSVLHGLHASLKVSFHSKLADAGRVLLGAAGS